jgi:hypothetical protein
MEACENCERKIGKLETAHLYQGKVVCTECNSKLRGDVIQTVPSPRSTIVEPTVIHVKPVMPDEIKTNVKQGAANGAAVCLLLAWAVAAVGGLAAIIIYTPLFFAAFVLSISAMAQKRIGSGLTVMVLTLISAPIFIFWSIAGTADTIQRQIRTVEGRETVVTPPQDQRLVSQIIPTIPPPPNPVDKVKVSNTVYYWAKGRFNEDQPIIAFAVYNGHNIAIKEIQFTATLRSKSRSVPWANQEGRYEIAGGVEPGETRALDLVPNKYGDDSKKWWDPDLRDRRDLYLDVSIEKVIEANNPM